MKDILMCVMIEGINEGSLAPLLSTSNRPPSFPDEPVRFADRKTGILMRNISLPSGVNGKINWILIEASVLLK